MSFPAITVAAGEEVTECVVVNLNNPTALHIGEIHDVLSSGAYDLVVYRSSDPQPQPAPFGCSPFSHLAMGGADSTLILSHTMDDDMVLPAGVGLTLQPNQMLRLELHALNQTMASAQVSAAATLTAMGDSQYETEAAFLFVGDPDISIPPNGQFSVTGFLPLPTAVAGAGATVSQISGYTHAFGVDVTVGTGLGSPNPLTSIYDPSAWIWSDAPRLDPVPPAQLPDGGGFGITCSYNNTTPTPVNFGTAASDEVCFFQAYASPASGAFVCLHSDEVAGGLDECCPGAGSICNTLFP